jgi:hypothetical protein
MAWIRLNVDVRPSGEVIGLSWQTYDDDGALDRISVIPIGEIRSFRPSGAAEHVWQDARDRLGLLPF